LAASALSFAGVDAYYGDSHVLQGVTFAAGEGRVLGLIGRNGAGKSTCMNVAVGLLPPRAGKVEVFGASVARLPPERIAALGVALVPQGRRVFRSLTVRENLAVAAHPAKTGKSAWTIDTVFEMFPRLSERHRQLASLLSGGEQQMLAIARGLMAKPRILLLDEPSLGLAPAMINELFDILARLRDDGVTILLVDQMAQLALTVADRGYVLELGRIVRADNATALASDPDLEAAYLGRSEAAQ